MGPENCLFGKWPFGSRFSFILEICILASENLLFGKCAFWPQNSLYLGNMPLGTRKYFIWEMKYNSCSGNESKILFIWGMKAGFFVWEMKAKYCLCNESQSFVSEMKA